MAAPGARKYPFFTHPDCEYFPCHEGVDPERFNCAFCYCPLYALGDQCGGKFTYTDFGIKDCTNCTLPHQGDAGIALVNNHWFQIMEMTRKPPQPQQ